MLELLSIVRKSKGRRKVLTLRIGFITAETETVERWLFVLEPGLNFALGNRYALCALGLAIGNNELWG